MKSIVNHQYPQTHSILIDGVEASRLLDVSLRTLWNLAHRDKEIPFVKVGKLVKYRRADLEAWVTKKATLPVAEAK